MNHVRELLAGNPLGLAREAAASSIFGERQDDGTS